MIAKEHRRIGLIVPSVNSVMEPDFYRHLPQNVSLHTARMYLDEVTVAGEERMLDKFTLQAARDLSTVRPHVVVFGCTSAGALRGREYDRKMCARISAVTSSPVVSVIESVNEALAAMEAKKVLVLTPYVDELNQRIKRSIEETGPEVLGIFGLGISDGFALAQVSVDKIVQFAREKIQGLNPDCLFISCTNFRAMEAISRLKAAFGPRVVTSNQAAIDKALLIINSAREGTEKPET